jgi:HD superfamily phosphodiesterase
MNSMVDLSVRTARDLLEEPLPLRWAHVRGVVSRAAEAVSLFNEEESCLLLSAAVLHDIGYAPPLVDTGFHALDGARYLRELNFPERLVALVAHHSCAYKEAEVRSLTAELSEWEDEETALRDCLWWADMTTKPDGGVTNVYERIEEIQKRYGPEDLVTFVVRQAKPELLTAVERTERLLRSAAGS